MIPIVTILVLALVNVQATDEPVPPDVALLERAEKAVRDGHYPQAVQLYRKLAKDHRTIAGLIGRVRSQPTAYIGWADILRHGPSANRVDVVIMGDGYRLKDQKEFDDRAEDAVAQFEDNEIFEEYFSYHNFLRANLVSKDYQLDANGRDFDTALDGKQGGMQQGQVTVDRSRVAEMLGFLPEHDDLAVVYVQNGSMGTGGGGVATIGGRNKGKTTIHEWGHAFAGLSDEYDTFTGHRGQTRNGINVAGTDDPEQLPWKHWIDAKVPRIGAYEGANGQVRGAWKPTTQCLMASAEKFCKVCREALVLNIYELVDPIDAHAPAAAGPDDALIAAEALDFDVRAMRPESHNLEARWWVFPAAEAPAVKIGRGPGKKRSSRGPLAAIAARPLEHSRHNKTGEHSFRFKPDDWDPGRYLVVCRVEDTTRLRGERWPLVLKDDAQLLQSEVAWWVVVE